MGSGAGAHASIAARAILEIDQQEILRFEQSLIQKIVEMQSGRNCLLLVRGEARASHGLDLLANGGESFQHHIEIGRRNFNNIDRVERGAGRGAFDRAEQTDFPEVITAAQISSDHLATGKRVGNTDHSGANQVKRVRVVALLADNLVLIVGDQLDVLPQMFNEIIIERREKRYGTEMIVERTLTIFFSSSALNEVPLKVGIFTFVVALVTSDGVRLPTNMSRITRSISTMTHSSRAWTVAERG